jgi:hypothetical protein
MRNRLALSAFETFAVSPSGLPLIAVRPQALNFEQGGSLTLGKNLFHFEIVLGVLFHEPPFINADLCVKDGTQGRRLRLQDRRESPVIGVKRKSQDRHHLVQGHVDGLLGIEMHRMRRRVESPQG